TGVAFSHPSFASGVGVGVDERAIVSIFVVELFATCVDCPPVVAVVFIVVFGICWALPAPLKMVIITITSIAMKTRYHLDLDASIAVLPTDGSGVIYPRSSRKYRPDSDAVRRLP